MIYTLFFLFFFNDTATTEIYTLSLHDALPIFNEKIKLPVPWTTGIKMVLSGLSERSNGDGESKRTVLHILLTSDLSRGRSEEHTSELQSHLNLVCRLLLEKKKKKRRNYSDTVR